MKYIKNFNKQGDSDYDDEVDSILAEQEFKDQSREQHFDDDEHEQEKLLNEENMQVVSEMEDIPEDKGDEERPKRDPRALRSNMDPQQQKALIADLHVLDDSISFNQYGLLSFNTFMHIFIIITRHSKEQFVKEQRKKLDERRRAFKVKDWREYSRIVQHELDMERLKYVDVVNFSLTYLQVPDGAYRSSFVKYSMKRSKDR